MAILPSNSTCLDLTISVPGSSASGGRRYFDINQTPATGGGGGEEEWMMMMAATSMEDEEEMCNGISSSGGGGPPRKKLRLSKEQSRLLEESFRQNNTLNPKQKEELAVQLKLRPRQVEVWFQNRRARSKLKQTEMECEYLKRWFGSLTEQNRRLQREVEELRAMKVGPPTVVSPHSCEPLPASSTLSMCPRCERVTATALDKKGPAIISAAATLSAKATKVLQHLQPSAAC